MGAPAMGTVVMAGVVVVVTITRDPPRPCEDIGLTVVGMPWELPGLEETRTMLPERPWELLGLELRRVETTTLASFEGAGMSTGVVTLLCSMMVGWPGTVVVVVVTTSVWLWRSFLEESMWPGGSGGFLAEEVGFFSWDWLLLSWEIPCIIPESTIILWMGVGATSLTTTVEGWRKEVCTKGATSCTTTTGF